LPRVGRRGPKPLTPNPKAASVIPRRKDRIRKMCLERPLTPFLIPSLPPSLPPSIPPCLPPSLPASLLPCLHPSLPHALTHSRSPSLTHSLTHSPSFPCRCRARRERITKSSKAFAWKMAPSKTMIWPRLSYWCRICFWGLGLPPDYIAATALYRAECFL